MFFFLPLFSFSQASLSADYEDLAERLREHCARLDGLALWGWGPAQGASADVRAVTGRLKGILEQLDRLPDSDPSSVFSVLREACGDLPGPSLGGALSPIQVLAPEAAYGQAFDACAVVSLTDEHWPPRPVGNALLPAEARAFATSFYMKVAQVPPGICRGMLRGSAAKKKTRSQVATYIKTEDAGAMPVVEPSATIGEVVEVLRQHATIKETRDAFAAHVGKMATHMNAKHIAWCMELCPETWSQRGKIQTHFHVCWLSPDWALQVVSPTVLHFFDIKPHVVPLHALGRGCRGQRGMWAGYFYCAVDKIGGIFSSRRLLVSVGSP